MVKKLKTILWYINVFLFSYVCVSNNIHRFKVIWQPYLDAILSNILAGSTYLAILDDFMHG